MQNGMLWVPSIAASACKGYALQYAVVSEEHFPLQNNVGVYEGITACTFRNCPAVVALAIQLDCTMHQVVVQ